MGDIPLNQPLPTKEFEQIDPFLLIHHGAFSVRKNAKEQDAGVGPHPHRGFSPVTFIFDGEITHRDSLGNKATVKGGGTQWMHAGKGITHSERPGQNILENGGKNEIIQFWVNTPASHKMDIPFYKPISKEETPTVIKDKAIISVVAGELEGVTGVAPTITPQTLLRLDTEAGADFSLDIPQSYNCLIYLLDGEMKINNKTISTEEMIVFERSGGETKIEANKDTRAILLSGEPIGEPVAQYGPFVMNSQTEVMQALRDSQMGKMGVLIEDF